MKIAIVHYHLNPGGVTRIIEMQLAALSKRREITQIQLFAGAPAENLKLPPGTEFICNPDMNYLDGNALSEKEIDQKHNRLIDFFLDTTTADTVIHAHNLNLGKNPVLTAALGNLVSGGRQMVNHIHDFAEDRPANIAALENLIEKHFGRRLRDIMYPVRENCRYAVLNSFYVERLTRLAIPPDRISLLPNPVSVETISKHRQKAEAQAKVRRLLKINPELPNYVYPVRGIRRKNLGEFILLASLFKDRANWIITLPPLNPVEKVEYDKWKEFCAAKKIPVIFEAGEKCAFKEIMGSADRAVTTSIREGFGMAFLEAWLFGIPVVGRDLPVTRDFRAAGIKLDGLYEKLATPEMEDFALLNQPAQMAFIKELSANPEVQREFIAANPQLQGVTANFSREIITENRKLIRQQYSIENYGEKLLEIYKTLV
ncbi:MAG: glycosyltransferase family 4 protein [Victivallaceae bacterium]